MLSDYTTVPGSCILATAVHNSNNGRSMLVFAAYDVHSEAQGKWV